MGVAMLIDLSAYDGRTVQSAKGLLIHISSAGMETIAEAISELDKAILARIETNGAVGELPQRYIDSVRLESRKSQPYRKDVQASTVVCPSCGRGPLTHVVAGIHIRGCRLCRYSEMVSK